MHETTYSPLAGLLTGLLSGSTALALAAPSAAQNLFEGPADRNGSLAGTTDVVALDLVGDALHDLVFLNGPRGNARILGNRGQGNFQWSRDLRLGTGRSIDAVVGDWDRNGIPDVAVLVETAAGFEIAMITALPSGQVGTQVVLTSTESANSLHAADVNGDGHLDLVVDLENPGIVSYLNEPSGFFPFPFPVTTDQAWAVTTGDLDGDGNDDVIFRENAGTDWVVARGAGMGGFLSPVTFMPTGLGAAPDLALADIDADGDDDFIVAQFNPQSLQLVESLGGLTFATPQNIPTPRMDPGDLGLEDVDGDGTLDITYRARGAVWLEWDIAWHKGLGGLAFGQEETAIERVGFGPSVIADLTGDSIPEWVAGMEDEVGPQLLGFAGNTVGPRFTSPTALGSTAGGFDYAKLVDVDMDGDLDLLALSRSSASIEWIENVGDGAFGAAQPLGTLTIERELLAVGDLNGDGKTDLVVQLDTGLDLGVRYGTGPGVFGPLDLIYIGGFASNRRSRAAITDLDADGDGDILFADGSHSKSVIKLENNAGTFIPSEVVTRNDDQRAIDFVDVDGDSLIDVVGLRPGTQALSVWKNDIAFGFGPRIVIPIPAPSYPTLTSFDVDGDGDIDIVGGGDWSANDGQGDFAPFESLAITPGPGQALGGIIAAADLDGDGRSDVISFYRHGPFSYAFEANVRQPGGTYGPAIALFETPNSIGTFALHSADLDSDSDADLVIGSFWSPHTLENLSAAMAGTAPTICPVGEENSTGFRGTIRALGSNIIGGAGFELVASRIPPGQFGMFIGSQTLTSPSPVNGSSGNVCLGGSIGRYDGLGQIGISGLAGEFRLSLTDDTLENSQGQTSAMPGSTWGFQAWHRDLTPTGATSNFTNAVAVTFVP